MTGKRKFAVAGFGHIGRRHASIIKQQQHGALVAVIDTDISLEHKVRDEFNIPLFSSVAGLKSSGIETDVIAICTPNGFHTSQALEALEAGYHVVIEKPMGLSAASCEQVIAAAEKYNRKIFCVMQNRYSPAAMWLKKTVEEGLLGEIFLVQLNCMWNRNNNYYAENNWRGTVEMDGGILFTQFSHYVDLLYWVFGDVQDIHSVFGNFNHRDSTDFEDTGIAHFNFVSGGMGSISFTTATWDRNMETTIAVTGEFGSIKLGGQYMEQIQYCHVKDYVLPQIEQLPRQNHEQLIHNVIEALNGNPYTITNARDGMKVVDIIERIYKQRPQKL
jgi:UDP-N-acetyl-2-amino-2-deoxyglucuronate dehydrogenase